MISQCAFNGTIYGDATPGGVGQTVSLTNVWGGDQYTLQAQAGCTYLISTCGGNWDSQITVFNPAFVSVAYNDDSCGLQSELTFTASTTGQFVIQVNQWNCASNFIDIGVFNVTLLSCQSSGGCNDPAACNYDPLAASNSDCCYQNCVQFTLQDSFGDGWNGASYSFIDINGVTQASGTLATGSSQIDNLCLPDGCYTLNVGGGTWDGEISWVYTDAFGNSISGVAGSSDLQIGSILGGCFPGCNDPAACNYNPADGNADNCCYGNCADLTLTDTIGDGWNGATYSITDQDGMVIATGTLLAGSSQTDVLCLPEGCYTIFAGGGTWDNEIGWVLSDPVNGVFSGGAGTQTISIGNVATGCTDPLAPNYDPLAVCDDGSCVDCIATEPTGCPEIELGDDISIAECEDPCVPITIEADYFETGETTSYSACSIPYAPPYPYTTGTQFSISTDDVWSDVINLPFDFCFYGTNYSQMVVGSNGVISFDISYALGYCPWAFTASCPSPALPLNSIFGVYHDIDPSVCGEARYAILGTAPCRVFVVNYNNVCHFSCNELISTSQIVLYETTNAIEVYVEQKQTCTTWNSGNALIGVQNATGTIGETPSSRQTGPWSASNEAWRFTPSGASIVDVNWYSQADGFIGTGPSIEVCPSEDIQSFVAEAEYTRCDGTTIVVADIVNVTCAMVLLPVEWLDFQARLINHDDEVSCTWETASEMNNDYFVIERSSDMMVWHDIGTVAGSGTTTETHSYQFIDDRPLPGVSYYRLRQVDYNGAIDFSMIRSVERKGEDFIVYPNPGSGLFSVKGASQGLVRVLDAIGREVHRQEIRENGELFLDVATGIYYFELISSSGEAADRIKVIVVN